MKPEKFRKTGVAAGIFAVAMVSGIIFPVQVAAQGAGSTPESEICSVPEQETGSTREQETEYTQDTEVENPADIETERGSELETETEGQADPDDWMDETDVIPDTDIMADTDHAADTETEIPYIPDIPDMETVLPSEKPGIFVLSDTGGEVEAFVSLKNGSAFPAGMSFQVLDIAEVAGESEEKEEQCREKEELLRKAWSNVLPELTPDRIRSFLPYYFLFADAEGKETALPDTVEVQLVIYEKAFYEEAKNHSGCYHIGRYGEEQEVGILSEKKMIVDEEKESVSFVFETDEGGWFSVLQEDGGIPESDGDTPENDTGTPAGDGGTPENGDEAPEDGGGTTEDDGDMAETDSGEDADIGLESLDMMEAFAARASLIPSGSPVTAPGTGFALMNPAELDGTYRTAHWYSGISSFVPFNSAGNGVRSMSAASNGGAWIFYPVNNTSAGKFGGIYQKILYREGVWYDLKMTVTSYTNKTYAGSDGAEVASYPPVGFSQNKIAWWLKPTMGEYVLKMEYFRHGDAQQTPVALNTRFQWWEIDNSQRFGIRTENGSIVKKFYQSADSTVYCKTEAAKADGNTYLFVSGPGNLSESDPKGNVGFVLAGCSRYYVAVGYRDHIQDSSNYRVSKATIKKWNQSLADGKPGEVTLGVLAQTDLDVPNPPDPGYPKKYVSNDGLHWAAGNTLPNVTSVYYYRIEQYIPWQTPNHYYEHLSLEDVLPAGVDYVGEMNAVCAETGQTASDRFIWTQENDVLTITPANTADPALYGYTYAFSFKVRMNPEEIRPVQNGNMAAYTVKNSSVLNFKHRGQSAASMTSNSVTTQASVQRQEVPAPVKGIGRSETVKEKQLSSQGETIVFSIFQNVPHNEHAWQPVEMVLTDELEPCLEYISSEVYCRGVNGYAVDNRWEDLTSGQSVVLSCDFQKQPPAPDGQSLRFDISCRLKNGADLSAWQQIIGSLRWYVIPNTAGVKTIWERGEPLSVEKETDTVTVKLLAGALDARISLTKEIDTADIVWAHGNPVFTFRISGEDVLGKKHTYYRMAEFTRDSTQDAEKASVQVNLNVPAGWYTAAEEKTMRYRLQGIHSVSGGIIAGETAVFDVSQGQTGSAVFYNVKTTDEGGSHSALVKNEMKK